MKVILIEDVKSLGKKGELVNVNDGYARNYILAKKLGVEATPKNLNDLKLKKANEEKRAKEIYEEAAAFAERLSKMEVNVSIKAGEGGKIFGSVSSKEIAQAAQEQLGVELDKKKMQLPSPIKSVGTQMVPIRLHPKVTAQLKVNVREA
ncbi:MAG: 50S ribosomal protein L9 [Lachnospiraceae bacterium]|nr:50S ribosomal protein L9 [Lachnospiraceae bacterium]